MTKCAPRDGIASAIPIQCQNSAGQLFRLFGGGTAKKTEKRASLYRSLEEFIVASFVDYVLNPSGVLEMSACVRSRHQSITNRCLLTFLSLSLWYQKLAIALLPRSNDHISLTSANVRF